MKLIYVTPLDPMSRRELLVGRLMPFVGFTLFFIITTVLASFAYESGLNNCPICSELIVNGKW